MQIVKSIIIGISLFINTVNVLAEITPSDTTIYEFCEKMPEFKGGNSELLYFIFKNLNITDENCRVTRLIFSFVVEKDGSLTNFEISIKENDVINKYFKYSDCSDKWLEKMKSLLLKTVPWNPGKIRGEKVRVRFFLPLNIDYQSKK